jgi:hypothetical protein
VVKKKRGLGLLKVLLVIGMLVSLFLVYEHFSPSASKFCTFGTSFDCGIVNKGPYANIDGFSYMLTMDFDLNLPLLNVADKHWLLDLFTSNAFLGFLTLLFILGLVQAYENKKSFLCVKKKHVLGWMKGVLLFGVLYGFGLFLIQHFILKTYCIVCLVLDGVLILSCIIVWRLKQK